MLIGFVSLILNLAIYAGILLIIIIGAPYVVDGINYTKELLKNLIVLLNQILDNFENAIILIAKKIAGFTVDLHALANFDILAGIC